MVLHVFTVANGMWTQIISRETNSDYIQSFQLIMQPLKLIQTQIISLCFGTPRHQGNNQQEKKTR
jgi:hypothetical protein